MKLIRRLKKIFSKKQQKVISPEVKARKSGVKIGDDCTINPCNFGSEPYLVSIGNHVGIATGVNFITHDGGVWVLRDEHPNFDYMRPIIVHDNCMIGINAIILPGVSIGPNSIVGAGAVVTKNVPPNCVVAGVPARVIKSLEVFEGQILPKCLPTKQMNREEKREYLIKYFGETAEEWLAKMRELDE